MKNVIRSVANFSNFSQEKHLSKLYSYANCRGVYFYFCPPFPLRGRGEEISSGNSKFIRKGREKKEGKDGEERKRERKEEKKGEKRKKKKENGGGGK